MASPICAFYYSKVQPWKLFGLMRTNFMEKVEHNTLARKSYSVFILTEYHTHTCAFYSRKSLTMEIVWDFASELRGESRVQLIGKEMSSGLTWC